MVTTNSHNCFGISRLLCYNCTTVKCFLNKETTRFSGEMLNWQQCTNTWYKYNFSVIPRNCGIKHTLCVCLNIAVKSRFINQIKKYNLNTKSKAHCKMSVCSWASESSSENCGDKIVHKELLHSRMAKLCLNHKYSDVTFIVKDQRLPAHRVMLATCSKYFRTLLYDGLSESKQNEIHLKVPVDAFKALLRYIYSGHLYLTQMDENDILDTLGLANQYGLSELESAISDYLSQLLALSNVCAILDSARLHNLARLTEVCLTYMDRNAVDLLQHESFKNLSKELLEKLLRRDSFYAPETKIFKAVLEWSKQNTNVDIQSVISYIRFTLMNIEDLKKVALPYRFLKLGKLLDATKEKNIQVPKYLPYRAALWPEKNVASAKFGSRAIQGDCHAELLNDFFFSFWNGKGCTQHCITDTNDSGIMVELGTACLINHIKILLRERNNHAFSYFVEVSVNKIQWDRVVDYSQYHCRSSQFLYFQTRPVRYIKLVGTHCTVNNIFYVAALNAMYTANMSNVVNDIVTPTENVATIKKGAAIESKFTNHYLINGDYSCYNKNFGYTKSSQFSNEIVVRFGQPYIIGSMRLLLLDLDDDEYFSFYIETSVNKKDWTLVVDKRNVKVRSWQNFSFNPLPVVFIRLVGKNLKCVHLECPSQDQNFLLIKKEKQRAVEQKEK